MGEGKAIVVGDGAGLQGNVDSGRGLDFQGHVLLESVMNLGGYTLETQMWFS